jgi:hypothetical protein
MGTGDNTVHIYAAAFADDLTVVAPTHKDYVLRMELTNKYLSFFGVEQNAVKTTYTYANTVHHHHPINIWNRHTHTQQHPHQWLPPHEHSGTSEAG